MAAVPDLIVVAGGSGYIGAHMVSLLVDFGFEVLVLDRDCEKPNQNRVSRARYLSGSLGDAGLLDRVFSEHKVEAVINFASYIQVGESVIDPAKYYANNISETLVFLDAMRRHGVDKLIFSSTAAIFGVPQYSPIDERHPTVPINPYGRSKLFLEKILEDYDHAYGLKSVCLRYFNAAGADHRRNLGERHEPETHLIPLVLQAASGRRESITVFGNDYDTPDGTCIRDYIHVEDLCSAHLLALNHLRSGGASQRFNLGNGVGFSVKQVIDTAVYVTGRPINVSYQARRPGDPAVLVADSAGIRATWGWEPRRASLERIIEDAWAWERKYPWQTH